MRKRLTEFGHKLLSVRIKRPRKQEITRMPVTLAKYHTFYLCRMGQ